MKRAPAVLGVSLVMVGSLLGACTDETTFTDEERAILETFKLPEKAPPNPSNRVADDTLAAVFGKKLFFDARFSGALGAANDGVSNGSLGPAGATGKVSCYACHQIDAGGADRRSRTPTSLAAAFGARNAPTVINAAFWDVSQGGWQLWDGRKDSMWSLALGPLEGADSHNGTRLQYAHFIYNTYRAEYESVFGAMPDLSDTTRFPLAGKAGQPAFDNMAMADKVAINRFYSNMGKALEAYQRLLVSPNFSPSPFDQFLAGKEDAMSPAAIRGAKLFIGKAACNECHRGPMFSDFKFHNIGCPQEGENVPSIDVGRSKGVPFVKTDVMNRAGPFSDSPDNSHFIELQETEFDLGAFRTPILRNVEKTAPYMHNGVYSNLWDVVEHYNFGGGTGSFSGSKEAAISPLLLTDDELDDLVEFLRAISDGPALAHDAFPEGLVAPPALP